MTRHKQILSEVQKRFSSNDTHLVLKINTFIDSAKWADENPKPGMVNKQEFIAKVRRWLEIETNWNMEYDECGRNDNYGKIDELVKYLEE